MHCTGRERGQGVPGMQCSNGVSIWCSWGEGCRHSVACGGRTHRCTVLAEGRPWAHSSSEGVVGTWYSEGEVRHAVQ